jgi:membrane-associated phospholipid phosphatase
MKIIDLNKLFFLILLPFWGHAQVPNVDSSSENKIEKIKPYIIPTVFITYGFVTLKSEKLLNLNSEIKNKISILNPPKSSIEEYLQFAPALAFYGLNFSGIKSKSNLKNGSVKLASAAIFMSTIVFSIKHLTKIERPDKSALNSFPSGHTATAFMTAEFLRSEYKHKSKWIGIGAYTFATTTAYYRMRNNRHWFNDVVAGAGVGILSAKAGEKIQPFISKLLNNVFKTNAFAFMPTWQNQQLGFSFAKQL